MSRSLSLSSVSIYVIALATIASLSSASTFDKACIDAAKSLLPDSSRALELATTELQRIVEDVRRKRGPHHAGSSDDERAVIAVVKAAEEILRQTQKRNELDGLVKEDPQYQALVKEEYETIDNAIRSLEPDFRRKMLDYLDPLKASQDVFVEIRTTGTNSDGDIISLFNMYKQNAEEKGLKIELESTASNTRGIESILLRVTGKGAAEMLRFESGSHSFYIPADTATNIRAGRPGKGGVPRTRTMNVTTYSASLESSPVFVETDVEFKAQRSSGPGGQNVNKTQTAVRATHIPTGITATIQSERSQAQNIKIATQVLRAKVLQQHQSEQKEKEVSTKRAQRGKRLDQAPITRVYDFINHTVRDSKSQVKAPLNKTVIDDIKLEQFATPEAEIALLHTWLEQYASSSSAQQ